MNDLIRIYDLDSTFDFGENCGKIIGKSIKEGFEYVYGCLEARETFCLSEAAFMMLFEAIPKPEKGKEGFIIINEQFRRRMTWEENLQWYERLILELVQINDKKRKKYFTQNAGSNSFTVDQNNSEEPANWLSVRRLIGERKDLMIINIVLN